MKFKTSLPLLLIPAFLTQLVLCLPPRSIGAEKAQPESLQWTAYNKNMQAHLKKFWAPPESYKRSHTVATWRIYSDGHVGDVKVKEPAESAADNIAAIKAVRSASPFAPLPKGAPNFLEIEFAFESVRPKPLGMTVAQALKKFGPDAKKRLLAEFKRVGCDYPPKRVTIVCLKDERRVLLFAKDKSGAFKQLTSYPIVSYSGELGPKLREGDLQIPEGFYKTPTMDANIHLCLSVSYPNQWDRDHAKSEHRTNLGGYIQIHEGVYSTGCIVISHDDMAEIFELAHDAGLSNVDLIIAPNNLLTKNPPVDFKKQPKWLPQLYNELKKALIAFPIQ